MINSPVLCNRNSWRIIINSWSIGAFSIYWHKRLNSLTSQCYWSYLVGYRVMAMRCTIQFFKDSTVRNASCTAYFITLIKTTTKKKKQRKKINPSNKCYLVICKFMQKESQRHKDKGRRKTSLKKYVPHKTSAG